jgi:hypothetical protein
MFWTSHLPWFNYWLVLNGKFAEQHSNEVVLNLLIVHEIWCYLFSFAGTPSSDQCICFLMCIIMYSRVNIPLLITFFWCFSISYFREDPRQSSDNLGFVSHIFIAWALQWCDMELLHKESDQLLEDASTHTIWTRNHCIPGK